METWKVLAVDTDYVFTSRSDNKKVHGVKLLLTPVKNETNDRSRFRGLEWLEQFISDDRLASLKVTPLPGDTVTFIFNRHGSIEEMTIDSTAAK